MNKIKQKAFLVGACFITTIASGGAYAKTVPNKEIKIAQAVPIDEAGIKKFCELDVKKYTKSAFFTYGETGIYGISVKNIGNANCHDIAVIDTLPEGMTINLDVVSDSWICSADDSTPQTVNCVYNSVTIPNVLPPHAEASLYFEVNVPEEESAGGVGWGKDWVENCAEVDELSDKPSKKASRTETSCTKTPLQNKPQNHDKAFKIKVKTDNEGYSNDTQFIIPTNPADYSYNYDVDCDSDGVYEATGVTGNYICEYNSVGEYTISISGEFPQIYHYNPSPIDNPKPVDPKKITSIEQWGDIVWGSMDYTFTRCENMVGNASDTPDLSNVESTRAMFSGAKVFNQDINNWDVSNVKNMDNMFTRAIAFNQPLENWDVSNVTHMRGMFYFARMFNQPIDAWDVSNVTHTNSMFYFARNFNQPIGSWDVSNVIEMRGMFYSAKRFNQNINSWDVSNVTAMSIMFSCTWDFNQPLDHWNVSNVNDMRNMFQNADDFNQDISSWDVSNVTNMGRMFRLAENFENHDLSGWDVSNVVSHVDFFVGSGGHNIEPNWP